MGGKNLLYARDRVPPLSAPPQGEAKEYGVRIASVGEKFREEPGITCRVIWQGGRA